jgi:hypothetical protein
MRMRFERTYIPLTSPDRTLTVDADPPPGLGGSVELMHVEWAEEVAVLTWKVEFR